MQIPPNKIEVRLIKHKLDRTRWNGPYLRTDLLFGIGYGNESLYFVIRNCFCFRDTEGQLTVWFPKARWTTFTQAGWKTTKVKDYENIFASPDLYIRILAEVEKHFGKVLTAWTNKREEMSENPEETIRKFLEETEKKS
jgi:hypothetical protein